MLPSVGLKTISSRNDLARIVSRCASGREGGGISGKNGCAHRREEGCRAKARTPGSSATSSEPRRSEAFERRMSPDLAALSSDAMGHGYTIDADAVAAEIAIAQAEEAHLSHGRRRDLRTALASELLGGGPRRASTTGR
jgi:hypothetical protein